jgi:hypothetical protein
LRDIRRISIVSGFITSEVNKARNMFCPPAVAMHSNQGRSTIEDVSEETVGS